jgi:enamine deaminase RidA (YjgF/YER057c/UK114 family)
MKTVQPSTWPRPSGYSNAIVAEGRIVAVAGQIGWNPETRTLAAADFAGQSRQALTNIVTLLQAAGALPSDVVRLTWYITDRDAYLASARELGEIYRDLFDGHYPAMSVVVVAGLLEPDALVEIEATAIMKMTTTKMT